MFSSENLDKLTADDFRSFLCFKNNQHWDSIHRQGGMMTKDMPRLRETIRLLVDENVPLHSRLDRLRPSNGDSMVKGLSRAVITPILQVVYPDKYGVFNRTTEEGMKRLSLWPKISRGATFADHYESINPILVEIAANLEIDLWTLDILWCHVGQAVASERDEPDA